jgi:dTDP-4-amino-4,6-dideoxy-D-galactose acyltransferase
VSHTTTLVAQPALVRLDWECDQFGFPVAQLGIPELNDLALAAMLRLAREQGVHLLVWPARAGREVPTRLLNEFTGALVDRKATFTRSLQPTLAGEESPASIQFSVEPYGARSASADLHRLAISAGVHSRFKVDRHFPNEHFEGMYRRWIERSVSGELADAVLVASGVEDQMAGDKRVAGMITLSESQGVGSIGLIAVAAAFRGRGIAAALMHAAHQWMRARGASEAKIVTQSANLPACRLYERSGYRRSRLQHYFHFWPQIRSHNQ